LLEIKLIDKKIALPKYLIFFSCRKQEYSFQGTGALPAYFSKKTLIELELETESPNKTTPGDQQNLIRNTFCV
jgi:hypothetical protein